MNPVWKRLALVLGVLLLLAGAPFLLACCLLMPFGVSGPATAGAAWLTFVALTCGAGLLLVYHANHSLQNEPSQFVRLPPLWAWGWGLLLVLALGEWLRRVGLGIVVFPPFFLLGAALPPLAALAWVVEGHERDLTWRRFAVAFVCGATLSVGLALLLEVLLPTPFVALVAGLFEIVRGAWRTLVEALSDGRVARALSSHGLVVMLVQLAVVAPLAEELAKPLFVLPLVRRAGSPRRAFLIGAAAGAGFAAVENLLYTGFGLRYWGGVLAVRALGAAVHPLGSGLVALGWYTLFHPSDEAGGDRSHAWTRFGLAVGVHALWNGSIVLLWALLGARFWGPAPAEVDVLGVTLAGVLLALLTAIGAAAWFGMRAIVRSLDRPPVAEPVAVSGPETDRAIAIWAVICLIVALSMGFSALTILGGGG